MAKTRIEIAEDDMHWWLVENKRGAYSLWCVYRKGHETTLDNGEAVNRHHWQPRTNARRWWLVTPKSQVRKAVQMLEEDSDGCEVLNLFLSGRFFAALYSRTILDALLNEFAQALVDRVQAGPVPQAPPVLEDQTGSDEGR